MYFSDLHYNTIIVTEDDMYIYVYIYICIYIFVLRGICTLYVDHV
jgi:hypothetical protein